MKRKIKIEYILLLLIFVFTLAFRLYFTFQSDNFSSDDAYFHLRNINYIIEEKRLPGFDQLSYSGKDVVHPPLFHIVLALLSFGSPFLLKIIPELLLAGLVFIVYAICRQITRNKSAALLAALMSGFVPLYISQTLNAISIWSLVLPILFLMLYCLPKLNIKKYLITFLVCSVLLPLTHSIAFLFILTIILYLILTLSEGVSILKQEKKTLALSAALIFLIELFIYRKAFLYHGLGVIWQNIPVNILTDSYKAVSIPELALAVGAVPLILGVAGLYFGFKKKVKNKQIVLVSAFGLAIAVLLVTRMIPFLIGMFLLGLVLAVLSALAISKILSYLLTIRFFGLSTFRGVLALEGIMCLVLIAIAGLCIWPSYVSIRDIPHIHDQVIHDLTWIKENTAEGTVVLGNLEEGNLIMAIAQRSNIISKDFLLAPDDPRQRLKETDILFTTSSRALALSLLKKHDVDIIYISDKSERIYDTSELVYPKDDICFKKRRSRIYEVLC